MFGWSLLSGSSTVSEEAGWWRIKGRSFPEILDKMKPVCNDEEKLPILIKRIMYCFLLKRNLLTVSWWEA